jgi:hypothetical protein
MSDIMKTTVGTVFTLAMLVLGTGVAHADPPSFNSDEQGYLRELHNDNIPVPNDQAAVTVGHDVCNLLASGGTKEMAMNALPSVTLPLVRPIAFAMSCCCAPPLVCTT